MIFQKSLRLFPFVWPALLVGLLSLVGCVHPPQSKIPAFSGPLVAPELVTGTANPTNALWQPMRGSPPATVLAGRERRALRLPCNFATSQVERASWDRVVQLDMSACRGVRFDLLCPDRAPVAHFNLYLRSGDGWYSGSFQPSRKGGWSSVVVSRDSMRTEGQPAGWTQIDGLRISAWRGSDTNTEFFIANLALAGADAPIVIVRADSAPADEAKTVAEFVAGMGRQLETQGLAYAVISDADVTAARLKGKRVVILPHNPKMPAGTARELSAYLAAGGKLLEFYSLPKELAQFAGIEVGAHVKARQAGHFASIRATAGGLLGQPAQVGQASWNIHRSAAVTNGSRVVATWFNAQGESTGEPALIAGSNCLFMTHVLLDDDAANKRALLMAMLGSLDEHLWKQTVADQRERVGNFGPYTDVKSALRGIRREAGGDKRARQLADEARSLYDASLALERERKYPDAIQAAVQSRERAVAAYCAAQQPQRGESRAWWCHSAFGVNGQTWDAAVGALATNGFTAVIPNMLWGGVAFYESNVLPVAPEVRERGDQIAACLAACRKYGVQCHVWKVNWNMGHHASKDFVNRMAAEQRTQVGFDGKPEPRWLCPSNPTNQQLEISAMIEVATKYDVDGIHFDYIRYPNAEHCFCPGCRARFEFVLGAPVTHWPADTRTNAVVKQAWLDFRRANITKVVAAVHDAVKQQKPNVQISAAVFREWVTDRDGVGQDWKVWCDRGYLDFVCPMDYTPDPEQFAVTVGRQLAWAGQVPLRPGIGISTWHGEPDVPKLIEMVKLTRQLKTGGFTIFNYGVKEAEQVLPHCGAGLTRP
jgi:uncharacterized lipoprotein YddW (UPF0748 family)